MTNPVNKIVRGPDGQDRKVISATPDRVVWEIKIGRTWVPCAGPPDEVEFYLKNGKVIEQ